MSDWAEHRLSVLNTCTQIKFRGQANFLDDFFPVQAMVGIRSTNAKTAAVTGYASA